MKRKIDYKKAGEKTWAFLGWLSKAYTYVIWFTIICLCLWGYGVYSSISSMIAEFHVSTLIFCVLKFICLGLTGWFLFWFYMSTRLFRTGQGLYDKADMAVEYGGKAYGLYKDHRKKKQQIVEIPVQDPEQNKTDKNAM